MGSSVVSASGTKFVAQLAASRPTHCGDTRLAWKFPMVRRGSRNDGAAVRSEMLAAMLGFRSGLIPAFFAGAVLCLAPAAVASPSHTCRDMHVSQLKPNGYSSERLVVSRRVLSCAQGRKLVTAYYTSHEEGKGSGAFRKLGSYNCGGGLSSLRGGVALLCNYYPRSFEVVLELRVPPLLPPASASVFATAARQEPRLVSVPRTALERLKAELWS